MLLHVSIAQIKYVPKEDIREKPKLSDLASEISDHSFSSPPRLPRLRQHNDLE